MAVGNRKAETPGHSITKHLIASILERAGHKVHIECELPDGSIADLFDETTGIIWEVQSKKQVENEKEKVRKYMNYALVKDIIFIYPNQYNLSGITNSKIYNQLQYKLGV